MKSTDMELQAIREKLQMLQAQPPAAEALTLPWSEKKAAPPQSVGPESASGKVAHEQAKRSDAPAQSVSQSMSQPAYSPQELAIEALKQRSSNASYGKLRGSDGVASPAENRIPNTQVNAQMEARADALVAKELYRLEALANNINERSQQQAAEIMTLKRSAQQASVALRRQGVHDHPQLEAITQFLKSYQSAIVPYVQRDATGRFTLTYDTIDFHQAEQDAIDTAQALRNLGQPNEISYVQTPFPQPVRPAAAARTAVDGFTQLLNQTIKPLIGKKRRQRHTAFVSEAFGVKQARSLYDERNYDEPKAGILNILGGMYADSAYRSDQFAGSFSWLDGMIWFSGAAIARITIQDIALSYPIVQTAFLVALVGIIVFAIYQVVIPKSNDYSLVYRLCIAMIGLFVAGMF